MSAASEFAQLQRLKPAEAIAYMDGRRLVTETGHYTDLFRDQHSRAFTISRLTRADLLERVQDSLTKATAGDLTRRDWINQTRTLLQKEGFWGKLEVKDPKTGEPLKTTFNEARLRLIYDTNVRQSLAAGQWQRMLRNKGSHPYARYVSMDDSRVRPLHRAWHNTVLPVDHPWWITHRPPNGYHCRCRVIGLTRAEFERGFAQSRPGAETDENAPLVREDFKTEPPPEQLVAWRNPATGQTEMVPRGIDPGFDYNPGTTGASKAFDEMVRKKLARLSPAIRDAAERGRLRLGLPSEDFMGQRPGLFELPPVVATRLTGDEFGAGLGMKELSKAATEALRALQAENALLLNEDANWLLSINKKGSKKLTSQDRPSLQALAVLRDLVLRAVVAERHLDLRHKNEFVRSVLRLYAPALIGDRLYRVKITVKDFAQGSDVRKLLHALEAVEIESAPLGTMPTSPFSGVGSTQPTTGRTVNIADLLRGAQRQDGTAFGPEGGSEG